MYVSARQFRIADGADEVHKSFVATKKARAYKPVEGWPLMHVPTRKAEARERFAQYLDHEVANL
jgi:acyl-CoA dehydrogenase